MHRHLIKVASLVVKLIGLEVLDPAHILYPALLMSVHLFELVLVLPLLALQFFHLSFKAIYRLLRERVLEMPDGWMIIDGAIVHYFIGAGPDRYYALCEVLAVGVRHENLASTFVTATVAHVPHT